jgi:N-acetyl-gamma-glutamyl-phosphate reductase
MPTLAILGASGYSGQETLDRALRHPELEIVALGSDSLEGESASALDVRLNGSLPTFVSNEQALASGADVILACLGNDRAAVLEPPVDTVVIDLSGAHRLRDAALYPAWYGFEHPRPGGLPDWSYAVPELYPPTGPLIANPGCYATAAILALEPLRGAIDPDSVVIDAKSGVSGAGRELKATSHAGFVLENISPYKVGTHQHAPEIAQALGFPVCFDVVRVLPDGVNPELARVQHTDAAEIGLYEDRSTGRAVVVCALDNLGKGAAGQAMQNANLALGLDETLGLRLAGVLV